jgi:hypothetical protein
LAWLVTRSLWGDLRRDLHEDDALAAEAMAKSVTRRMRSAQPELKQLLGFWAKISLQEPYSDQVPTIWPRRGMRRERSASVRRRRRILARTPSVAVLLIAALGVSACGAAPVTLRTLPLNLVPAQIGLIHLKREPAAEKAFTTASKDARVSSGLVYTVRHDDVVEGSVQIQLFKPDVDTSDIANTSLTDKCIVSPETCPGHEIFKGIQASLGAGHFHRLYYDGHKAYEMFLPDLNFYLWFPPGTNTVVILALRRQFTDVASMALLHGLLDYESGRQPADVPLPRPTVDATPAIAPVLEPLGSPAP